MKNRNQNYDDGLGNSKPSKAPKGARYQSKKNYFSRNVNGAISNRNRDRRLLRRKRRADYWATAAGQSRKFEKMNTPVKLKRAADNKTARDFRRHQRKLEADRIEKLNQAAPVKN